MEVNKKVTAAMIGLGAAARLLPHPWNFTPLVAIGLYAGARAVKLRTGILAVVLALLLSDAVMGFYRGMWYVYAALLIPVVLGRLIRNRSGVVPLAAAAACSSLAFYLTSNFMVWATGHLYAHTISGLAACYAAGIPFYGNQALGDVFYVAALFGGHALMARFLEPAPRAAY